MAISKTGIHVDESSSFNNPLVYEENGQVNSVVADSLTPDTRYYTRGYVISDGQTVYSGNVRSFRTDAPDYFEFQNPNNSSITLSLKKNGSPAPITGETSIDGGSTWNTFNMTGVNIASFSIPAGGKIKFRGNNSTFSTSTSNYYNFQCSSRIDVTGNIMTLVDKTGISTTIPCSYCFYRLFYNMTTLDNDDLILTATRMPAHSYDSLFYGCSGLTTAPDVYAYASDAGSDYICARIFYGCTSLTTPPRIYKGIYTAGMFESAFENCSSLTETASITSTEIGFSSLSGIYDAMYKGCSSLTETATYHMLDGSLGVGTGSDEMYMNCTNLKTINITFPSNFDGEALFKGCTSLEEIDLSNITSIRYNGMDRLLDGCSSLKKITAPSVSTWDINKTTNWVRGVSSTGDFYLPSGLSIPTGVNGIPSGWTTHTI